MIWYQTLQRNLQRKTQLPALALGLLLAAPDAPAGRPLTVDDAGIADFGNCQLESWVETSAGKSAAWAMPACNFTGNWELALGAASLPTEQRRRSATVLQGKTVLRPLADNSWGAGLVLARQAGAQAATSINLPVSLAWQGQDTLLHANLGAIRPHGARTAATWGLALERQFGEFTGISLERFGQHGDSATTSVGWRRAIVPGRLQLDASWGRKSGQPRSDTWSLGLVWTGAPLQ